MAVQPRLCAMMFLQYAVWGAWMPYLANYLNASTDAGGLGFSGGQVGWIMGLAASIGAVTSPIVAGQVADRWLNAERALAILLVVGGVVKFATAYARTYETFLMLSVVYSVAYMPTLALTNSLAFSHLDDPERKFPPVRMWGTLGWIAASTLFPLLWLRTQDPAVDTARIADALKLSGALSVLYAVYCVQVLPATPPRRLGVHALAFARAFALLRRPGFLVVTLAALPISMIHQAYFFRVGPFFEDEVGLPVGWVGPALSIGQWSEIVFLALLGLFLKRLGYRGVLALGGMAYTLRFAIFSLGGPMWLMIVAQAMHGLCYGCFFAGAYIYVERVAPADVRHSAQTVFSIIILGAGPVLAGWYNQYFDRFTTDGAQAYVQFWHAQSAVALGTTLLVLLFFRPDIGKPEEFTAEAQRTQRPD